MYSDVEVAVAYYRTGVPDVPLLTNTRKCGNSQYRQVRTPYTKNGPIPSLQQRAQKMRNGYITIIGEPDERKPEWLGQLHNQKH
jgi:hypothetical protein